MGCVKIATLHKWGKTLKSLPIGIIWGLYRDYKGINWYGLYRDYDLAQGMGSTGFVCSASC